METLTITENGEYNVSDYTSVVVDVQRVYHEDLVNIYNSIILVGGVMLAIYFFYCIYRMFMRNLGG